MFLGTNKHTKKIFITVISLLGLLFCAKIAMNHITFSFPKEYKKPEKIGILAIATGRYNIFWKNFYESSEKYFLPEYEKQYYLFTDDFFVPYHNKKNVHLIKQKKLGWPYDTMMRFDFFLSQKNELIKYDYLYFFNINLKFKKRINEEVFPDDKHNNLVVVSHWLFYDAPPTEFTFERNKKSTAYIPYGKGKHYSPGGLFGGTAPAFIKLSETCSKNIKTDLNNGIIAKWHDESHLNKYMLDKNPLILPINYMWPEEEIWDKKNGEIKAILRDKKLYGGKEYLRGETNKINLLYLLRKI